MMFANAYWAEVAQLIAAIIGVGLLHWALWDAIRDTTALGAAEETASGSRMILALNNVRAEMIKLAVMALLVLSGVIAVMMPPPAAYTYPMDDPKMLALREEARLLDPNLLLENDRQHVAINAARFAEILITVLLVVDTLFARRMRATFVRRVRLRADATTLQQLQQQQQQLAGAVAGAEAGAKAGAEAGAEAAADGTAPEAGAEAGAKAGAEAGAGVAVDVPRVERRKEQLG